MCFRIYIKIIFSLYSFIINIQFDLKKETMLKDLVFLQMNFLNEHFYIIIK